MAGALTRTPKVSHTHNMHVRESRGRRAAAALGECFPAAGRRLRSFCALLLWPGCVADPRRAVQAAWKAVQAMSEAAGAPGAFTQPPAAVNACPRCTLINNSGARQCAACGARLTPQRLPRSHQGPQAHGLASPGLATGVVLRGAARLAAGRCFGCRRRCRRLPPADPTETLPCPALFFPPLPCPPVPSRPLPSAPLPLAQPPRSA